MTLYQNEQTDLIKNHVLKLQKLFSLIIGPVAKFKNLSDVHSIPLDAVEKILN